MTTFWRRIKPVDIPKALAALPRERFFDTGGTNGWLMQGTPDWLAELVAGLGLGGATTYIACRKLPAWQGIPPHIDPPGRKRERRFHVPLVTHPAVVMRWPDDDTETHLEAGWLYEVDHHRLHEVVHRAPIDRIHVQIDQANATI